MGGEGGRFQSWLWFFRLLALSKCLPKYYSIRLRSFLPNSLQLGSVQVNGLTILPPKGRRVRYVVIRVKPAVVRVQYKVVILAVSFPTVLTVSGFTGVCPYIVEAEVVLVLYNFGFLFNISGQKEIKEFKRSLYRLSQGDNLLLQIILFQLIAREFRRYQLLPCYKQDFLIYKRCYKRESVTYFNIYQNLRNYVGNPRGGGFLKLLLEVSSLFQEGIFNLARHKYNYLARFNQLGPFKKKRYYTRRVSYLITELGRLQLSP